MENGLLPAVPAVDNDAVGENGADSRRAARTATWFRPPRARPDAVRPWPRAAVPERPMHRRCTGRFFGRRWVS